VVAPPASAPPAPVDDDSDESSGEGDRHGKDYGGHEKARGNGHTKDDDHKDGDD
jgi:hypothetical protein